MRAFRTYPTRSCQMRSVCWPTGKFLITNRPSPFVFAMYGFARSNSQPRIHGWMLQSTGTGRGSSLVYRNSTELVVGIEGHIGALWRNEILAW